jgi:hypothetical protein
MSSLYRALVFSALLGVLCGQFTENKRSLLVVFFCLEWLLKNTGTD